MSGEATPTCPNLPANISIGLTLDDQLPAMGDAVRMRHQGLSARLDLLRHPARLAAAP